MKTDELYQTAKTAKENSKSSSCDRKSKEKQDDKERRVQVEEILLQDSIDCLDSVMGKAAEFGFTCFTISRRDLNKILNQCGKYCPEEDWDTVLLPALIQHYKQEGFFAHPLIRYGTKGVSLYLDCSQHKVLRALKFFFIA